MSTKLSDAGLVILGLATAALIAVALRHVQDAPPSPAASDAGSGASATASPTPTPTSGESDDAAATSTGPSESAAQTSTTNADDPSSPVTEALGSDEPVTVLVLGDSTSNETDEWVQVWGETLGDRPVQIAHWNEASGSQYNEPIVLSDTGDGSEVMIWSGSQSGYGPLYAAERLDLIAPETPDAVIYNYGQVSSAEDIAPALEQLRAGLQDRFGEVPATAMLQNPRLGEDNADVREAVQGWADEHDIPTIDVAEAFTSSDTDLEALMDDEVQPSSEGSQLWADTVAEAINP